MNPQSEEEEGEGPEGRGVCVVEVVGGDGDVHVLHDEHQGRGHGERCDPGLLRQAYPFLNNNKF